MLAGLDLYYGGNRRGPDVSDVLHTDEDMSTELYRYDMYVEKLLTRAFG